MIQFTVGEYSEFWEIRNESRNLGDNVCSAKPFKCHTLQGATTKRNKENRDNTPSKSNPKDAAVIARVSRDVGFYSPYEPRDRSSSASMYWPRFGTGWTRTSLVSRTGSTAGWMCTSQNTYLSSKTHSFPRSIATLHQCPTPEDLKGLSPEDVVDKWATQGMRRPGGI